jgi:hypothetical protein
MEKGEQGAFWSANKLRMDAIGEFENKLLTHSVLKNPDDIVESTQGFISSTLGYTRQDAAGLTEFLKRYQSIPDEDELYEDYQGAVDNFKMDLADHLTELYAINFTKEEFNEWIGPYLEFTLKGHEGVGQDFEHDEECATERECPAFIFACIVIGRMTDRPLSLDQSQEYVFYSDQIVNMNVNIVEILNDMGILDDDEALDTLQAYKDWLDEVDYPFEYDESLFDNLS